jgi:signal transduction histidine kinase
VVTGNCYLIKKKHADQADIVEGVLNIEQSIKATEKILDFAKAFEQLGVEELVMVDVEKEVDEAAKMFSGLTFKIVNGCKGLTVLADSFLRQLVYNLIDNTRKYGKTTKVAKLHYKKTQRKLTSYL